MTFLTHTEESLGRLVVLVQDTGQAIRRPILQRGEVLHILLRYQYQQDPAGNDQHCHPAEL